MEEVNRDALIRATFDAAPDGIVLLTRQGRLLAANARFLALWNFPPEVRDRLDTAEMREHSARQVLEPQRFVASLRTMLQMREPAVVDEVTLLDGRVFERHVSPLMGQGVPDGIVIRWRDVSARHQAQRRLAAIFEHAFSAILLADDQGRCLDANPAACALLGYTRQEILGLQLGDVLPAEEPTRRHAGDELRSKGRARSRVRFRRADGTELEAEFATVADVQPGVHLSMLLDVTEDARARQRLQELTALLDLAMLGADLAYWDVNLKSGQVDSLNGQWRRMLGFDAEEQMPTLERVDALIHPEDLPQRQQAWEAHVRGDAPRYEAEFRVRHKDGHWVWILARGRAIERDESGRATRVVGTRMDVTERRAAQEQLTEEARTDVLTGVPNRRHFLARAEDMLTAARRRGEPLALLMMDLDHFKGINDRLGHAAGDEVLRQFARRTHGEMRERDLFGRLGGEEFACLLFDTDEAGARTVAERVLQSARGHPAPFAAGPVAFTVSVGIAVAAPADSGLSVQDLLQQADGALYLAKAAGRDRAALALTLPPAGAAQP